MLALLDDSSLDGSTLVDATSYAGVSETGGGYSPPVVDDSTQTGVVTAVPVPAFTAPPDTSSSIPEATAPLPSDPVAPMPYVLQSPPITDDGLGGTVSGTGGFDQTTGLVAAVPALALPARFVIPTTGTDIDVPIGDVFVPTPSDVPTPTGVVVSTGQPSDPLPPGVGFIPQVIATGGAPTPGPVHLLSPNGPANDVGGTPATGVVVPPPTNGNGTDGTTTGAGPSPLVLAVVAVAAYLLFTSLK